MIYPHIDTQLKSRVMRRVYGIWFVKKVVPWACFEIAAFGIFIFFMDANMHFLRVYGNAKIHTLGNDPLSFIRFMYDAFMYTEITVQLGVLGLSILLVLITKNVVQSIKTLYFSRQRDFVKV